MSLHNKYRPKTLKQIIGHESVVATLRGFIASEDFPSAILLVGPPSSGKTTLARAFASEVLGQPAHTSANYEETNWSENRSIEDVRGLISVARMRPMNGSRRFIMCDEAQGILSNAPAANAALKPLEEPTKSTTWILASMDADKFASSTVGKAIASRCIKIRLEEPSPESLVKQAKRILKGEGSALEDAEQLASLSGGSFRSLANVIEAYLASGASLDAAKAASPEHASEDAELIVAYLTAALEGNFYAAQRALASSRDGVGFIQQVGYISWSLVNLAAFKGKLPAGMWASKPAWTLFKSLQSSPSYLKKVAELNSRVVQLRLSAGAFAVNEQLALSSMTWEFCKFVKELG